MTGTLAIWHERAQPNGDAVFTPAVELHFNLWRDSGLDADFADIGIKLEAGSQLKRLIMFFPIELERRQLVDLSSVLKHGKSLNAVFNDVVEIVDDEKWFDTKIRGVPFTRVHPICVDDDFALSPVEMDADEVGTVLSFTEAFCKRFHADGSHYIRFRIYLTTATKHLFSSDIVPDDWFALSSSPNTELTEFRLNERRTMPALINKRYDSGPLNIKAIHYFLIRDLRHELLLQHQDFRKIRVLEMHLWRHYLRGRHPESKKDMRPYRRLRQNRLAIYQWREMATKSPDDDKIKYLDSFNAFAKFRISRNNLVVYFFAIAFIGALGSGVFNFVLEAWRLYRGSPVDAVQGVGFSDAVVAMTITTLTVVLLTAGLWILGPLSTLPFKRFLSWPGRKNSGRD